MNLSEEDALLRELWVSSDEVPLLRKSYFLEDFSLSPCYKFNGEVVATRVVARYLVYAAMAKARMEKL